jgi:glycosyltransferase involved in cell wall biosynthesis
MMATSAPVRVLSNVPMFSSDNAKLVHNDAWLSAPGSRVPLLMAMIRVALKSYRYEVIFLNCAGKETLVLCALLFLLPFNRAKVITADLILRVPTTRWQRFRASVTRMLLRKIRLFIFYHRDFTGYERYFGVDSQRAAYVPFKVNSLDIILRKQPSEGDYLFTGGTSLRDWDTLMEAVKGVSVPVVILSADDALSRLCRAAENLTVIRDDGSTESWIRHIAASKFVVLPISSKSIAASGISTYLCAMALRKCVIITEGPATKDILNETNAVLVPPEDPKALRQAIEKVNENTPFRRRVAEAGYQYALSCGDTSRLHRDFISWIHRTAHES